MAAAAWLPRPRQLKGLQSSVALGLKDGVDRFAAHHQQMVLLAEAEAQTLDLAGRASARMAYPVEEGLFRSGGVARSEGDS